MATRNTPSKGGKPDKLMRDAIIVALNREADDGKGEKRKRLYIIADQLVEKGCGGDLRAIEEINNRVDGKSVQPLANDTESPLIPDFKDELLKKLARFAGG